MDASSAYTGFVLFFGALIAGRFACEGAIHKLGAKQKAAVLDAFATFRRYNAIVLAGSLVALMTYPRFAVVGLAVYVVGIAALTYTRLQQLNVPAAYVRSQLAAMSLTLVGSVVVFGLWLWS